MVNNIKSFQRVMLHMKSAITCEISSYIFNPYEMSQSLKVNPIFQHTKYENHWNTLKLFVKIIHDVSHDELIKRYYFKIQILKYREYEQTSSLQSDVFSCLY